MAQKSSPDGVGGDGSEPGAKGAEPAPDEERREPRERDQRNHECRRRSEADTRHAFAEKMALGRMVTAGEVAAAVAYLASPDAAAVNGQTIILDGGGMRS